MSIYEPEHKSKIYILIIVAVASLLGWGIFVNYRPMIVKAGCAEIAANSSGILRKRFELEANFTFDEVKRDCIEQTLGTSTK